MKPSNQQRRPNPLLIPAGIGALLAGASLSVPAAATGGGPASTPFSFDLFALQTVDVRHGSISGRIAAGQGVSLEQFSSAYGPGLSPATDVLISGGDLVGTSGTVVQGNAVYGAGLALDPSFVFASSSQPPRAESVLDFEQIGLRIKGLSTSWGMTPATGTTLIADHNILLTGAELGANYFEVPAHELIHARTVTVQIPHGSSCIINVDGGFVTKYHLGFRLIGTTPERVVVNFFEGRRIVLGNINLEASVLAPCAVLSVEHLTVFGGLCASNLRLRNAGTQGRLFIGAAAPDPLADEFHAGQDGTDAPGYTLTWWPDSESQVIEVRDVGEGELEVLADGQAVRRVRRERLERLVFAGRSSMAGLLLDPQLGLPVELGGLAPVAYDDHATLPWGGTGVADVLANDLAGPAPLDPSTVQVLGSSRHGTVTVDPLTGSLTYRCTPGQLRPIGLRGEVVEYTVQDTGGATSTPRRVRFSFEESPSGLFAR